MGATTSQTIAVVGGTAGSTISTLATTILATSAIGGPVGVAIGAAVAGIAALLGAFGVGNGCGQSCITASNDANAIEAAMRANLAAYQNGQIDQATAIATYNQLWSQLVAGCQQVGGSAGQNCISDRQQGACHFKDANDQCWNWDIGYRQPLTLPPTNAPAVASISGFTVPQVLGLALLGVVALEAL